MMQSVLTQFPWLSLSSVALLIFFLFFVALLIIVNLKPQKTIFRRASMLPLDEPTLVTEDSHVRH